MDGSGGHPPPLEWHPGPYGYDPYTNTFLPLPCYGGWGTVEYSCWNPQQGPPTQQHLSPYSSSSSVPLGRPPLAAAQRGRGGRHGFSSPRQHGGRGLLGSDPSSQLPPPRRRAPADEPSSSQPPAQVQPPVPVPLPPENNKDDDPSPPPPADRSPSSHAMTPPVSDSDPMNPLHLKNSLVVDVSMADAKRDDAQDDVLVLGLGRSSTSATDKKRLLPIDPPAAPMKTSDVDVSMARRDDGQGDVLGLNVFMAKKRLLSTKASLAADADADEEAKAAARKKTRLSWGQGLAKYENRYRKDDENTHKLVAHDGEAASSHGSSPPPGSKGGHGNNNSFLDMAEMRVPRVTTAPAFSKGSSPLTGDLGDPGKNGSISSFAGKVVSPAQVTGFTRKHSPSPAAVSNSSLMSITEKVVFSAADVPSSQGCSSTTSPPPDIDARGSISMSLTDTVISPAEVPAFSHKGGIDDRRSISNLTETVIFPKVSAVPRKEDNSDPSISNSSTTAIGVSELASSQGSDGTPGESSTRMNNEKSPRMPKVIVKLLQKPRTILDKNVLYDDEEPKPNELQGPKPKEWSQEEKDAFSEMITAFAMDFSKVSSFLRHKTTADCMEYYYKHYKSECHKEAQKCLPTSVMQSQENCCNENDAAPLLSGIATVTATKNYERMNAEEEDVKKPVNQICYESTANLLAHSLPDKGHGESFMDENEHVTGKVLCAAPSPFGMRSSQAVCVTIPKTEAQVLENFNEDRCSNEAVCITKSCSKVKENVPQSVLIANLGDEGHCVAGGSCGQDILKIMSLPDESCAKLANGTIKGDQIRSGAKTLELCSSWKECNDAAKHHSWKATEKKVANSNIDDGRKAPSDMKTPNSKDNPYITCGAAKLTGKASVQFMMKYDQAMERRDSEKNDDKVKGTEGNNPVLCVSSKECSGIQLSCEVNSQKEIEKVDSIPSPEGNGLNADMENPTNDSSPCVATNAAVARDDLIQRLRASEAMYTYPGGNEDKVKSKEGNPVHSVVSKECNVIPLSCNLTSQKGKGIMPSPEVYDLNAAPMQISNGAPKTYHLPSSSGCAALDIVHANSSYVAMDIDLNIPLDVTSVDLENSHAESSMGPSDPRQATDSTAIMEISPSQTTTTIVPQTAQQQPANPPAGSIMLFGHVIYQAPSTGTTNHTTNQGNQTVVSSSNMPSNPVVAVTRRRGGQVYPSGATTTSMWRSSVPNNQQGQQAVLTNKILYGGSTNGAAAASPLQPRSSAALVNMMSHQRQQALVNITPYSIMRGGVPVASNLIPGSSGGAGFLNFNGFNSVQQQQWPVPVLDTSRMVFTYPFYYPGATANQAPATATTMPSTGTNNGEGASTSNTRAPPAAGRGRGGNSSWLSLRRD